MEKEGSWNKPFTDLRKCRDKVRISRSQALKKRNHKKWQQVKQEMQRKKQEREYLFNVPSGYYKVYNNMYIL